MEENTSFHSITNSSDHEDKEYEENNQKFILKAKIEELLKTKAELNRTKENATQSWLDSKPLIDELERMKSELEIAKNRASVSKIEISEIESELEKAIVEIRSKKEEELKARKTINEMNREAEEIRGELERLEEEKGEEERERAILKRILRVRKQSLRTLQLKIRAVRIETEAFGASAAEAVKYIGFSDLNNSPVELTQEEFYNLRRRSKEETSLAAWRISVCEEQRIAAETARDSAARRLQQQSFRKSLTDETKIVVSGDEEEKSEEEEVHVENRGSEFPKARAMVMAKHKQKGRSSGMNRMKGRKGKASFLVKIKGRILRIISRLFR